MYLNLCGVIRIARQRNTSAAHPRITHKTNPLIHQPTGHPPAPPLNDRIHIPIPLNEYPPLFATDTFNIQTCQPAPAPLASPPRNNIPRLHSWASLSSSSSSSSLLSHQPHSRTLPRTDLTTTTPERRQRARRCWIDSADGTALRVLVRVWLG